VTKVGLRGTRALALTMLLLFSLGGCSGPGDDSMRVYVDGAIAGLSEGYFADGNTWNDAVDDALPGLYAAESIPETYPALRQLTKVAGGEHSFFSTPTEAARWEEPYSQDGVPMPAATYESGVGTITIPGFSSARQDEIDQYLGAAAAIFAAEPAQEACGWVIDLRFNEGGNLFAMLAAVSPLLDEGKVEGFRERDGTVSHVDLRGNTVTWDGKDTWDGTDGSLPGEPIRLPGRSIAIVQSAVTASAAESVIIAFAGQAQVETFGVKSGGFTTVNDGFELSDGAYVTLSFALMQDRDGNVFEGGIMPDHDTRNAGPLALQAAHNWAVEQCEAS